MADTRQELRGIRLTGAVSTTEVRFGTLLGVQYVVAPIVMLVGDSVIFPINAEHPEFVPADVLAVAPAGWSGRPLMSGDHPALDGAMVSANIPVILEGHQFGQLFNAHFKDNRLQGEVWIDPNRAAQVPDGLEILQRIKDGDPVEISVGAFVVVERANGTHNGREYGSIWREITPDHVALLREGLIGACSIEMGCGTPRAARHHQLDAEAGMRECTAAELTTLAAQALPAIGDRVEIVGTPQVAGHKLGTVRALQEGASGVGIEFDSKPGEVYNWYVPPMIRVVQRAAAAQAEADATAAAEGAEAQVDITPEVRTKLIAFLGSEAALVAAQGMSDTELREMLMEALKRIEPQCVYIQAVTPDDKTVVYLIDPDPGGPAPLKPYQRSYEVGANNAVTFSEERIPVRRREEWVPVAGYRSAAEQAADAQAQNRAACGCGGHNRGAAGAEGDTMPTKAERITALIGNPRSPFEETDRAYLETLSDERIAAAEAKAAEPTPPPASDTAADADTVTVSAEELTSLRALAAERDRNRAAQKRVLVGKLKTAQATYNEQRLNAMELEQLQEVAALLQIDAPAQTEFVGLQRDIEEPAAAAEPPRPYALAIAKRNGAAN